MADLVSHPDEIRVVSKRFGQGATNIDRYLELDGYKAVRKALGITPGQKIRVVALVDRLEFIPVKPAKALRGFTHGINTSARREKDRV